MSFVETGDKKINQPLPLQREEKDKMRGREKKDKKINYLIFYFR